MFKRSNKRGQSVMDNLTAVIIGSAALLMVVVVTFLLIAQTREIAASNIPTNTTVNQSVTWINGTFVGLTFPTGFDVSCISVNNNVTGFTAGANANLTIQTGNWTCTETGRFNVTDRTTGELVNITNTVQVTFSFKVADDAINSTNTLRAALNNSAVAFFGLIFLVIVAGLIIGIVRRVNQ